VRRGAEGDVHGGIGHRPELDVLVAQSGLGDALDIHAAGACLVDQLRELSPERGIVRSVVVDGGRQGFDLTGAGGRILDASQRRPLRIVSVVAETDRTRPSSLPSAATPASADLSPIFSTAFETSAATTAPSVTGSTPASFVAPVFQCYRYDQARMP